MSHHQDLNIVLWVERGEILGDLLNGLRTSSAVLTSADATEQVEARFGTESDLRVG